MDLITLEELENALGVTPADDLEEANWIRSIKTVSNFIISYCDTGFELILSDSFRTKASWRGEIHLPKGPTHKIRSVVDFRFPEGNDLYIDWDGMDTLFNASPNQVVLITYDHGLDGAPDDVKDLCYEGCDTILNGPESLKSFQVGDVNEVYTQSFMTNIFGGLATQILSQYGGGSGMYTIEVGGNYYPDFNFQGWTTDSDA